MARQRVARQRVARLVRHGVAGHGVARHGGARRGKAGVAWLGMARKGTARHGVAGGAGHGVAWHGVAALARQRVAGHGEASRGSAVAARRGSARQGVASQGEAVTVRTPRIKDTSLLAALKLHYDECEITGETYDLHLHHVIFKSHGGDDLRGNIICISGDLHDQYHRGRSDARRRIADHVAAHRPDVVGYITLKLGSSDAYQAWLSRHGIS